MTRWKMNISLSSVWILMALCLWCNELVFIQTDSIGLILKILKMNHIKNVQTHRCRFPRRRGLCSVQLRIYFCFLFCYVETFTFVLVQILWRTTFLWKVFRCFIKNVFNFVINHIFLEIKNLKKRWTVLYSGVYICSEKS